MLDNIKYIMCYNSIDRLISANEFEDALNKLNYLISIDFKLSETLLKRGKLCKKLLMYKEAYTDFTHIINNFVKKQEAYEERLYLNYEMSNYYEAISDANELLQTFDKNNFKYNKIKLLSQIYLGQNDDAIQSADELFNERKYKILQFLFNEVAYSLSKDEYAKGLRLLEFIDIIDKNNPLKLLKEANIYALSYDKEKHNEIMQKIDIEFPKYFISHFQYTDMYEEKDILEVAFLLELQIFDNDEIFKYPFKILEGYKNQLENHIIDSKECFEEAIKINPNKPEGYVLLAQTYQLMSGYDNPDYKKEAEINYKKALDIYIKENMPQKIEEMKRQLCHLNSSLLI